MNLFIFIDIDMERRFALGSIIIGSVIVLSILFYRLFLFRARCFLSSR